jgi:hypothetical protein
MLSKIQMSFLLKCNIIRFLGLLLFVQVSAAESAGAQCNVLNLKAPYWKLVFADEFDKPTLNDSLWVTTPGGLAPNGGKYAGWGSEYYPQPGDADYDSRLLTITPADPDPSAVGVLHLTALPLHMTDSINTQTTYNKTKTPRYVKYKSAIIRSKTDASPYGAYIMRARLPVAIDYQAWPTFWLWSCTTEIDILDGVGVDAQGNAAYLANLIDNINLKTTAPDSSECLNNPFAYPALVNYTPGTLPNRPFNQPAKRMKQLPRKRSQLDTSFNTYAAVWTPEKVVFYFNEKAFLTVPRSIVRTMPKWHSIMASLQMFTKAQMEKPYTMDIDYIKVYQINTLAPDGKTPNFKAVPCN